MRLILALLIGGVGGLVGAFIGGPIGFLIAVGAGIWYALRGGKKKFLCWGWGWPRLRRIATTLFLLTGRKNCRYPKSSGYFRLPIFIRRSAGQATSRAVMQIG